ncbi:hypothetical protein BLOT_002281 [Blomia tropicalis]|nr:hypothetical protein BLOT_002281 [Blomia tropicalis]
MNSGSIQVPRTHGNGNNTYHVDKDTMQTCMQHRTRKEKEELNSRVHVGIARRRQSHLRMAQNAISTTMVTNFVNLIISEIRYPLLSSWKENLSNCYLFRKIKLQLKIFPTQNFEYRNFKHQIENNCKFKSTEIDIIITKVTSRSDYNSWSIDYFSIKASIDDIENTCTFVSKIILSSWWGEYMKEYVLVNPCKNQKQNMDLHLSFQNNLQ